MFTSFPLCSLSFIFKDFFFFMEGARLKGSNAVTSINICSSQEGIMEAAFYIRKPLNPIYHW